MSNQEMQFADPDWKPSQQLDTKTNPQEQEVNNPQPINTGYREQNQWRTTPPSPSQQEGYTGLRPYAGPAPQQRQGEYFGQRQYRRRGRGPWFWIILAIIIISLMSGGWRSFNGPGFDRNHVEPKQIVGKPIDYTVTGQATIVIFDPDGNVTVTEGQSNTVMIRAVNNNPFGNPNNLPLTSNQSPDGKTINVNAQDSGQGPVDLKVVVPNNTILQLQTDSGDININGVEGQMTLKTNSGSINTSNDVLSGSSTMSTRSGHISFDGTMGTGGSYQFQSNSGTVDLTVPSTPAFHVDATTDTGSITSDFPSVSIQKNSSGSGSKASGDVGGNSQGQAAKVTITTGSGDINLHQG